MLKPPRGLIERVLSDDVLDSVKSAVESGRLRLLKRNPELIKFVSEVSGVQIETLRAYWDSIYRELLLALKARRRRRVKVRPQGVVTPATALYAALLDVDEKTVPEVMYRLLEPLVTREPGKAVLLFLPVTPARMRDQAEILAEVVCGSDVPVNPRLVARVFCTPSIHLPAEKMRVCIRTVEGALSCRGAGSS